MLVCAFGFEVGSVQQERDSLPSVCNSLRPGSCTIEIFPDISL